MINQRIYNIDFNKLTIWLLPTFLRKQKMFAWLKVLLSPIIGLYNQKQLWRADIRYKLQHNGQVVYLEKILNEYYDVVGYNHQDHQNTKQIYIGDGERPDQLYIYTIPEQLPKWLLDNPPIYIYTETEMNALYSDFIVWIPISMSLYEEEVRALIDYYINTKIYKIKTY